MGQAEPAGRGGGRGTADHRAEDGLWRVGPLPLSCPEEGGGAVRIKGWEYGEVIRKWPENGCGEHEQRSAIPYERLVPGKEVLNRV